MTASEWLKTQGLSVSDIDFIKNSARESIRFRTEGLESNTVTGTYEPAFP